MIEKKGNLPSSDTSRSRYLRWGGTLVSSALFIWLLFRQDWSQVWVNVRLLPLWVIVVSFGLYFTGMIFNALRWFLLVRSQGVQFPFLDSIKIVLAGAFASNFLPSTIGGDSFRIVSLFQYSPDRTMGVASVVMDRFLNVFAMFTVLPFAWLAFGSPFAILEQFTTSFSDSILVSVSPVVNWSQKIKSFVIQTRETLRIWIHQPFLLLVTFLTAWLSILVVFLAILLLGRALRMPINLIDVMGVNVLVYLLTLLPVSINGYGVREVLFTGLYMQLGAGLEQAATLAVITRFITLTETLPGVLWLTSSLVKSEERG